MQGLAARPVRLRIQFAYGLRNAVLVDCSRRLGDELDAIRAR